MAVNKVTRSQRRAQPNPQKLRVYETLFRLNEDYERVLADLKNLEPFGIRRKYINAFCVFVEEVRAFSNLEVVEAMQEREEDDWGHWGHLRDKWEKRFEDPNDVLIAAERRKKQLKQEAARKKLRKRKPSTTRTKHRQAGSQ